MKKQLFLLAVLFMIVSCSLDDAETPRVDNISDLKLENLNFLASNIPDDFYDDLTFTNENTGYAISRNGKIIKTLDGGENWTVLNSPATFPLKKVQFLNQDIGYVIGGDSTGSYLLKTINAGNTWVLINLDVRSETAPNGMFFKTLNEGYITGENFFIKTFDGGQTWSDILGPSNENFQDINFNDNHTLGYATLNSSSYYKSTNGGISWQSIDGRTENRFKEIYFVADRIFFKSNSSLVNINTMQVTDLPDPIYKLLNLTDEKSIGIGQHFETGFFPYGDVILTNNSWQSSTQKSFQPSSEVSSFTAIAKMSNHKTMILGTGLLETTILVLTY